MMPVPSLGLMGLLQESIFVLGLSLNVAHIILDWVFSMLFSDFKAQGLRSIPMPPLAALTVFQR